MSTFYWHAGALASVARLAIVGAPQENDSDRAFARRLAVATLAEFSVVNARAFMTANLKVAAARPVTETEIAEAIDRSSGAPLDVEASASVASLLRYNLDDEPISPEFSACLARVEAWVVEGQRRLQATAPARASGR